MIGTGPDIFINSQDNSIVVLCRAATRNIIIQNNNIILHLWKIFGYFFHLVYYITSVTLFTRHLDTHIVRGLKGAIVPSIFQLLN